jgi:ABC-2 type transport system permease protein
MSAPLTRPAAADSTLPTLSSDRHNHLADDDAPSTSIAEKGAPRERRVSLSSPGLPGLRSVRGVFDIWRWEFVSFFLRPAGWLMLLTTLFVATWSFSWLVTLLSNGTGIALRQIDDPVFQFLGPNVFLIGTCTLLVPLLTMNLIADERRRGTWETLLTAAYSPAHVVIGKFLAAWSLLVICFFPWMYDLAVLRFWNGKIRLIWSFIPWFDGSGLAFDMGPVYGAFIGLAVIGGTFVAFGVFCSAGCRSPVAAAALTFAGMLVVLVLSLVPRMLTSWHLTPEQIGLVEGLSCWGQFEKLSQGVVSPRLILAHISVSVVLLSLAAELARWRDNTL